MHIVKYQNYQNYRIELSEIMAYHVQSLICFVFVRFLSNKKRITIIMILCADNDYSSIVEIARKKQRYSYV